MKKRGIDLLFCVVLFFTAGLTFFLACRQSNQAMMAVPFPLVFEGEYSQNGGQWKPLEEGNKLSAFDGDLILRGNFTEELPEGAEVIFYLNHIGVSIYSSGQVLLESGYEQYPDMCGKVWETVDLVGVTAADELEIRLHNPHRYGNRMSYQEFLNSFFMSSREILSKHYDKQTLPYRCFCMFLLITSIALIGTAVGYQILRLPDSRLLLEFGVMSLLTGVYMYLDTKDIHLRSEQVVFNTYGRQLTMMLAAWMLVRCIAELLQDNGRKLAEIVGYGLMLADFGLIALALTGVMRIYDTGIYWAIAQGLALLILLLVGMLERKSCGKKARFWLISSGLIEVILLAELVNGQLRVWPEGMMFKTAFSVLYVITLIQVLWMIAKNYQNSLRTKKLQEEIKNSRVVLAMSQIRTHFIFNVLNAISGMCEYDPQRADETLVVFSRYLRNNINIMDEDKLEVLSTSIGHLEDYIQLEQVRFGEKVRFEKHIESEDFLLPPLVLQPIIENSLQHGLLRKKQGGTVRLHTWTEKENHVIEIADDGVGFDTAAAPREGAVGMKNVRFRIEHMVGGRMDVSSNPGKGTIVTLTIPKEMK